jgi:protein SCO1/2
MSGLVKCGQGAGPAGRGVILALLLVSAQIASASAHSLKGLENQLRQRERYVEIVNKRAPDFTLRDADGTRVKLSDFKARVVVLSFVYTNCSDVCPLHSAAIASIQKSINQTPMKNLVQFITITTDPLRDTPVVMQDYGSVHGLDPVNWVFLTSGPDQPGKTRKIARRYGLEFTLSKDGYQMHGGVTHLIDKGGNLRARYHGLKFNETNMIVHINALTNDYH